MIREPRVGMTHPPRTLWEEGHESGTSVVALGAALTLTVAVLDVAMLDRVTVLFDVCFVMICTGLALLVRPADFFVVGVLPPLLMAGLFVLLAATSPAALGRADDSMLQALIRGLSHHSVALLVGYALALAVLLIRRGFVTRD
ncbi:DUF6542 domain-containing protein [Nocardioides nanhaiensis]|uniref:DUF6542 domain-containing protein n=1 Tax=Nocardioides nanhaiensis TaxID=1476871 RepID=A0ABP8W5X1_9ACTN